jgi:hypothetical protein
MILAHEKPLSGSQTEFGNEYFSGAQTPSGNRFVILRTIWLGVALTAILGAVAGCGERKGVVTGQVTFKDSPLPDGKITFICEGGDKPALSANIRDGSYEIKGVPVGLVRITVATYKPSAAGERPPGIGGPTKRPGSDEAPPTPPGKYVEIPLRYGQPDQSNLTFDVKTGANEHNIALTP